MTERAWCTWGAQGAQQKLEPKVRGAEIDEEGEVVRVLVYFAK